MTLVDLLTSGAYRDYLLGLDAYLKMQPFKHEELIEPIIVRVQVMGRGAMSASALAC